MRRGVGDRRRRVGPGLHPQDPRVGDQIDTGTLAGTVQDVKQVAAVDDDVGSTVAVEEVLAKIEMSELAAVQGVFEHQPAW